MIFMDDTALSLIVLTFFVLVCCFGIWLAIILFVILEELAKNKYKVYPLWIRNLMNPYTDMNSHPEHKIIGYDPTFLLASLDRLAYAKNDKEREVYTYRLIKNICQAIKHEDSIAIKKAFEWYYKYRRKQFYQFLKYCFSVYINENKPDNICEETYINAYNLCYDWLSKCSPSTYNDKDIFNKIISHNLQGKDKL